MKRSTALAALLAVLAPATAGAQGSPTRPYPIGPASGAAHGITVSGLASAHIPATSARITLRLGSADRRMALDTQSVQPIVDALVKAGAQRGSVHLPITFSAPGASSMAEISATFAHPSAAQVQRGVVTVGSVIAGLKDVVLSGADVYLTAANCSATLAIVRNKALADAHAQAASIAHTLNLRMGDPVDVRTSDAKLADGSCIVQYYISPYPGPQGPQTAEDYVTVPVTSVVSVTYAIR